MYLRLGSTALDALREVARRELREPRQQAEMLVLEGLRARGLVLPLDEAVGGGSVTGRVRSQEAS